MAHGKLIGVPKDAYPGLGAWIKAEIDSSNNTDYHWRRAALRRRPA